MKSLFLLLIFFPAVAFAQSASPSINIEQGMHLKYQLTLSDGGQPFYTLTIDSLGQGCKLSWASDDGDNGSFIISEQALNNGNSNFWGPVQPDYDQPLNDETVACMSRSFLKELKQKGSSNYSGIHFEAKDTKDTLLTINNKPVKTIYAESPDGDTRLWLLNNQQLPLILKLIGNPSGPDVTLYSYGKD